MDRHLCIILQHAKSVLKGNGKYLSHFRVVKSSNVKVPFSAGTISHFSEFQCQFCNEKMVVTSDVSQSPNSDIIQ